MELLDLALHVQEMRRLQKAYFASRKAGRYGDKKLLAASKAKEAEVDEMLGLAYEPESESCPNPFWQESRLMDSCRITQLTWIIAHNDEANGHLMDLWETLDAQEWESVFGFPKHNETLPEAYEPHLHELYDHFMEGNRFGLVASFDIREVAIKPDAPRNSWYSGFHVYADSLAELALKIADVKETLRGKEVPDGRG